MTIDEQIIETIKDCFAGCGVKQKEDGRIVTYFTPYSATEFTEKLAKDISILIQKEREEAVRGFISYMLVEHGLAIDYGKAETYLSQTRGGEE